MNNLQEAKESLAKSSQLNSIISPPKTKRIKLPTQRDINMIEQLINNKLKLKAELNQETLLTKAKTKWQTDITQIHQKAISLKKETQILIKRIEKESNNTVKIDPGYSHYWHRLPETITEALGEELLEIEKNNQSQKTPLEQEIEETMLDIKLGLKPISDVKALLEKIDNIK